MKRITDFEMINATDHIFPLSNMPCEFISQLRDIIYTNLEFIIEQQPIV